MREILDCRDIHHHHHSRPNDGKEIVLRFPVIHTTPLMITRMDPWEGLHHVFMGVVSDPVIGGGIGSAVPVVGTVNGGALGAGIGGIVSSSAY